MKVRVILFALAVLLLSASVCLADDPHMGTWKLNGAKSKFAKGATKNNTVVYESVGGNIKVTVDGVNAAGAAIHSEWTGKFNGKFFPVTGDPSSDQRAYRRINSRLLALTGRKNGRVNLTGRVLITGEGRTRTVTTFGPNAKGKKVTNRAVYDKV